MVSFNTHDLQIFVCNIDNLKYTKDCIYDLMNQIDFDFDLTVVDNGSVEPGTKEYMAALIANGVKVVEHQTQQPLNHLWNWFHQTCGGKYICLLNNDTRLARNYTKTIKEVFEKEPDVDCVVHVSNNPRFATASSRLKYEVMKKKIRQGWDFTMRREAFVPIPTELNTFCGDDWLYANIYKKHRDAAIILSSPIVHYMGMSGKSTNRAIFDTDVNNFNKYHMPAIWPWSGYSVVHPMEIIRIKNDFAPLLTVAMVTYKRHEDIKTSIKMWLAQTDPHFKLEIWQDGKDDEKRAIVESLNDGRIVYKEIEERQNKFGHNMRHQSIMECDTLYWCTTNDDNWPSPLFVETVLKNIGQAQAYKYSVAMQNIPIGPECPNLHDLISNGCTDFATYNAHMKTLDTKLDICGDVDACSFVLSSKIAKEVGWTHMEFEGDWLTWKDIIDKGVNVKRENIVLQVHR